MLGAQYTVRSCKNTDHFYFLLANQSVLLFPMAPKVDGNSLAERDRKFAHAEKLLKAHLFFSLPLFPLHTHGKWTENERGFSHGNKSGWGGREILFLLFVVCRERERERSESSQIAFDSFSFCPFFLSLLRGRKMEKCNSDRSCENRGSFISRYHDSLVQSFGT